MRDLFGEFARQQQLRRAIERTSRWWEENQAAFERIQHQLNTSTVAVNRNIEHGKELDRAGRPTRATKVDWLCSFVPDPNYRRVVRRN